MLNIIPDAFSQVTKAGYLHSLLMIVVLESQSINARTAAASSGNWVELVCFRELRNLASAMVPWIAERMTTAVFLLDPHSLLTIAMLDSQSINPTATNSKSTFWQLGGASLPSIATRVRVLVPSIV